MTITVSLWNWEINKGFFMTLLTGLTAPRHLLSEQEHLDHLDDDTGAYSGLDRNNLTIAISHEGLIDDHDALIGLEADHRISEGPPDVA